MQTDLDKRKDTFLLFIKSKLFYILTGFAIFIGAFIRTRDLPLLKDKLLLAVDPYVFYRYTKYIVEHGSLMALDTMRYVPLGYDLKETGSLLSYILAYTYKFISVFIPISFEKFNILYPVVAFVFAMVVFFFLVKKLFNIKIACLATAFLAVLPGFVYRTSAGFSEKEPIGILLMFLTLFFYIYAFQTKTIKKGIIFGILSGVFSGLLITLWGGAQFIFIIIPIFTLIALIINKINKKELYVYLSWFIVSFLITIGFVFIKWFNNFAMLKNTLYFLFLEFYMLVSLFTLLTLLIDFLIFNLDVFKLKESLEKKFPSKITSLVISSLLSIILTSIIFSPTFLMQIVSSMIEKLIHPMGTSRFVLTVAEARQPYFVDLKFDFYWFFHLFFLGSILLFYNILKPIGKYTKKTRNWFSDGEMYINKPVGKHYKWFLTTVYTLFISAFIFSRYSKDSILNGENFISNFLYIGSLIAFILVIFGLMIYLFYHNKELYNKLKNLNLNYIFVFIWFLLTVVGARGAMRLFFVFAPTTAIMGAYFSIKIFYYIKNLSIKIPYNKVLAWVFLILILIAPVNGSLLSLTRISYNVAKKTGPYFDNQMEKAMDWVRQNTPKDAVFAHWWDYGYLVQAMGERATILDGGNAITYWNHLMGRHVLTGNNSEGALEFLKTHEATHLLIIDNDINKYPSFSQLGSDENYDRYSYLPRFISLPQDDTRITKNETLYLYRGQFIFDGDFIYNGQIFPKDFTAIVGFIIPIQQISQTEFEINQPTAIVINSNEKRFDIPLECVFFNDKEVNYDKPGIKGCFMFISYFDQITRDITSNSAGIYISEKVRKTLFTQMFLFGKEWEGFELVYDDSLKSPLICKLEEKKGMIQNIKISGPLKIWKINYPPEIKTNPEYLKLKFPSER